MVHWLSIPNTSLRNYNRYVMPRGQNHPSCTQSHLCFCIANVLGSFTYSGRQLDKTESFSGSPPSKHFYFEVTI